MIDPAILIGEPLVYKNIKIFPPKVKDVVANPNFSSYQKLLTITEEDVKDELLEQNIKEEISPFKYLMAACYNYPQIRLIAKEAFKLFCRAEATFLYAEALISLAYRENGQEVVATLNEADYFDFQNHVRVALGNKPVKPPQPADPNEDPRIAKMKEKIRMRDRAKEKMEKKGQTKGGISLSTCLIAICYTGMGLNPLNIGEISYASITPIMRMMQNKEKYDIDIRSLLAGADAKKVKPVYWIRDEEVQE